jgi:hemerythrin-like metal-binding protein
MNVLQWSDALALNVPAMDRTHQEFVVLLADVAAADDAHVQSAWDALVEHTEVHFAQEDYWMGQTRFAAGNCHSTQHATVLQVLRQGQTLGRQGQLLPLRQMADELVQWFPHHAQTMDAALAAYLLQLGFDPDSGAIARREPSPAGLHPARAL